VVKKKPPVLLAVFWVDSVISGQIELNPSASGFGCQK